MNHDHQHPGSSQPEPSSPSRPAPDRRDLVIRSGLTVLIIIGVIYLLTSHWLHVLDALPYIFVVGMMAMYLFGYGGHASGSGNRSIPDDTPWFTRLFPPLRKPQILQDTGAFATTSTSAL